MSNKNNSFLNNKVITRGPKKGYCRICKQYGNLTKDHIPPKGSFTEISSVELRTLTQDKNIKSTISEDGTNFRTICSYCNNTLLGTEYDPELNKVSNKVGNLVKQTCNLSYRGLFLPPQVSIEVKPQRLARAIVGHLLASNYNPDQSNIHNSFPFPEALRNYFLDQSATLPEELKIYYWFYPSNRQVLIFTAAMGFFDQSLGTLSFCLMKFFPIAYCITFEETQQNKINLPTLFQNRNIGIDDVETIQIKLNPIIPLDFPEVPRDEEEVQRLIFLNNQSTSIAFPRRRNNKKGFGS